MKAFIFVPFIISLLFSVPSCSYFHSLGKKSDPVRERPAGHRDETDAWEDEQFSRWCEETVNVICSEEYNYPYADED